MSYYGNERPFADLLGVTLASVKNRNNEELHFTAVDGRSWRLYHSQHCCESVAIESIVGDLDNLIGSPITMADVSSNDRGEPRPGEYAESWTWTFYKLATVKGYVDIRWLGESNGYYGEGVDFVMTSGGPNVA